MKKTRDKQMKVVKSAGKGPSDSADFLESLKDLPPFVKIERFIESRYDLQFNEVSNEIEFLKEEKGELCPLNENNLFRELHHANIKVSLNNLIAILRSDFVKTVDPFYQYFNSLPVWSENDPDYISELAGYVETIERDEFNLHFKKTLVRCVACALFDKYFNKHAFILVGETQNTGKSTFIRFLCPPALNNYISESLVFSDKDNLIGLSSNFIINLDELAALSRVEINALKSLFSKEQVKIRHPYGRKAETSPRRASFFGSTNKLEFLSDETGSVRWLCFEIESINWDYSTAIDINKVWAQAFQLFRTGFKYQLTAEEIERNERRNKYYQHSTIDLELIHKHYIPGSKEDHDVFYRATDFYTALIEKEPAIRNKISNMSIGRALKLLRFERATSRVDEHDFPIKGYYVKFAEL